MFSGLIAAGWSVEDVAVGFAMNTAAVKKLIHPPHYRPHSPPKPKRRRLPIMHPDFVYRPASNAARASMSASQRKRMGIPDGFRRLFGNLVPDGEQFERVRRDALAVFNRERRVRGSGSDAAGKFVVADTALDFDLLCELFGEGVTASEAADFFEISEHHAEMKIKGWREEMRRRRRLKL